MAVSRKAMTEGIRTPIFLCALIDAVLRSLRQKSKIFASSLYTREPLGAPAPVHLSMFLRKIRELCHIHTTSQRHGLLTVTASLAGGCSFWSANRKTGTAAYFCGSPGFLISDSQQPLPPAAHRLRLQKLHMSGVQEAPLTLPAGLVPEIAPGVEEASVNP